MRSSIMLNYIIRTRMIVVKPFVIVRLFVHKQIVRLEIKLNREDLSELLANFEEPFIRKERRG
jgi:hypothetical protein